MLEEKVHVLLVDERTDAKQKIENYLQPDTYTIHYSKSGMDGFEQFKNNRFPFCIIDVDLPYKDAVTLGREIKSRSGDSQIVYLSSNDADKQVLALCKELSDYFINDDDLNNLPSLFTEILEHKEEKVEENIQDSEVFQIGNYQLNTRTRILQFNDEEPLRISVKENKLLHFLSLYMNDLLPREIALTKIWKENSRRSSRCMDIFITKLRKLLVQDERIQIVNVRGKGYKLLVEVS